MLLSLEAQPVRWPAPPPKRHRHVSRVGCLGRGEAGA